jgi:phloroglucinol synthase
MNTASIAHEPAVEFPEHVMTLDGMIEMAGEHYSSSPAFDRIVQMIGNTEIENRRFALEPKELGRQSGLAERTELYMDHAMRFAERVALQALENAELRAKDIDLVVSVSCTGFVMPSLDAYLINKLGLRNDVKRMPIAQLGCSGGVSALLKAHDYCLAYPDARILIVAVEMSSLCYFPEHTDLTSAVCASIFGDGAGACVVTGSKVGSESGLKLRRSFTYTMPDSEHYIRYKITDGGYHLTLDKGVMHSIPKVAPMIESFLNAEDSSGPDLDFVLAHTGGKRILNLLVEHLGCKDHLVKNSRDSLNDVGNTASVSIMDVMHRAYHNERPALADRDNRGVVVAFGPGFTMDVVSAQWS